MDGFNYGSGYLSTAKKEKDHQLDSKPEIRFRWAFVRGVDQAGSKQTGSLDLIEQG